MSPEILYGTVVGLLGFAAAWGMSRARLAALEKATDDIGTIRVNLATLTVRVRALESEERRTRRKLDSIDTSDATVSVAPGSDSEPPEAA